MLSALELAQLYFQKVWVERERAAIAELSAAYAVGYEPFGGTKHISDVQALHDAIFHACPDFTLQVEKMIASGEHVATRWLARGTHTRDIFGIEARHRPFEVRGVTWFRIRGGQIIEAWDCWDQTGLMQRWAAD